MQQQIVEVNRISERLNETLSKNDTLTLCMARDRLNYLCKKYSKQGYISADEYAAFTQLGWSYIKSGGDEEFSNLFTTTLEKYPCRED